MAPNSREDTRLENELEQRIQMIASDAKKRNPMGFKQPTNNVEIESKDEQTFVNPQTGQAFVLNSTAVNIPSGYLSQ